MGLRFMAASPRPYSTLVLITGLLMLSGSVAGVIFAASASLPQKHMALRTALWSLLFAFVLGVVVEGFVYLRYHNYGAEQRAAEAFRPPAGATFVHGIWTGHRYPTYSASYRIEGDEQEVLAAARESMERWCSCKEVHLNDEGRLQAARGRQKGTLSVGERYKEPGWLYIRLTIKRDRFPLS